MLMRYGLAVFGLGPELLAVLLSLLAIDYFFVPPILMFSIWANKVVRIDLAAGLPPVWGDRVQLQPGLLNLVMNSIDAMKAVTDRP